MEEEIMTIPRHVAIILDGNGRWAKKHNVPRSMGHKQGCDTLEKTIEIAARLGVEVLTVYGFSTENWKRSAEEVDALMQLFRYYAKRLLKRANESNVKVRMIGERSRFDADLVEAIESLETTTANNTGMTFVFAINYGGRDEITRAARRAMTKLSAEGKGPEDLTEELLNASMDTAGLPELDLLIRPSGEQRISNFLLWQCAYAEFYYTNVLWPDFSEEDLVEAIRHYNRRDRRFGGRK